MGGPMGRIKERTASLGKSRLKKQAVVVRGRKSSISVEAPFWEALKGIAATTETTLRALVAEIDQKRERANLSSAVRLFVLGYYQERAKRDHGKQ